MNLSRTNVSLSKSFFTKIFRKGVGPTLKCLLDGNRTKEQCIWQYFQILTEKEEWQVSSHCVYLVQPHLSSSIDYKVLIDSAVYSIWAGSSVLGLGCKQPTTTCVWLCWLHFVILIPRIVTKFSFFCCSISEWRCFFDWHLKRFGCRIQ